MNARGLKESFVNRYLEPADSLSEVFFGLLMVLTFTLGTGLAVGEDQAADSGLVIAIIGCNLAWGVIDGVMYMMGCLFERSQQARMVWLLRQTADPSQAIAALGRELDPRLGTILNDTERQAFYRRILTVLQHTNPKRVRVVAEDVYGAIASFFLVFLSTIPAVIPFIVLPTFHEALRISNLISIVLLFWVGYAWAKFTNTNRWVAGVSMLLLGLLLVLVAIALGG